MSEIIFPVFETPEFVEEEDEQIEYKKSIYWDSKKGDFAQDGAYRIKESNGRDAYIQWCVKTVATERFCCLAYSDEIGVEEDAALKEPSREAVESAMERTITEALMVNPKTEYVRDFEFEWEGDDLYIKFVIKGIELEEEIIQVVSG